MASDERARADQRLEAVLSESGRRDPREFYRERLRELRERDREAYEQAVRYYEETLVPSVASGSAEPLSAWMEYGRRLAELSAPGRTLTVDASGRAQEYEPDSAADSLVLHLPQAGGGRALLVALPRELSPAQRATYDWLVAGRQKLRDTE